MALKESEAIIGPVRLSYMNVFHPRKNLNGEDELSVVCLIPKASTKQCLSPSTVRNSALAIALTTLRSRFGENTKGVANPVKDGDVEGDGAFAGYWYFRAKRTVLSIPITLVDGDCNPVTESDGWTSGDWAKVHVRMYAYDVKGKRGVSFGLQGLQFLYKDEPFGDTSSAFEPVPDAEKPVTREPSVFNQPATDEADPFIDGDDFEDAWS